MTDLEIIKFDFSDVDLWKSAFRIRKNVFVDEQHVDERIEHDFEEESIHYLALKDKKSIATARWRETSEGIKLERFATLKEYRKSGAGSCLLNRILEDVFPLNKQIYLNSQVSAVSFYEKHHFSKTGNGFYEADILHFKMILNKKII
jgi:predicted GNAT family N-acyltransferase